MILNRDHCRNMIKSKRQEVKELVWRDRMYTNDEHKLKQSKQYFFLILMLIPKVLLGFRRVIQTVRVSKFRKVYVQKRQERLNKYLEILV